MSACKEARKDGGEVVQVNVYALIVMGYEGETITGLFFTAQEAEKARLKLNEKEKEYTFVREMPVVPRTIPQPDSARPPR